MGPIKRTRIGYCGKWEVARSRRLAVLENLESGEHVQGGRLFLDLAAAKPFLALRVYQLLFNKHILGQISPLSSLSSLSSLSPPRPTQC